jgi:hypothetical protein
MLTSPSANIAGSQTQRFIELSFSPPGRDDAPEQAVNGDGLRRSAVKDRCRSAAPK